jgi:hypothetical protein
MIPVKQGAYLATLDLRARSRGIWIAPAAKGTLQTTGTSRQLLKKIPFWFAFTDNELFYQMERVGGGDIHRLSLPVGKEIPLGLKLPSTAIGFGVRFDGKEMVVQELGIKSRYVAIEKMFK